MKGAILIISCEKHRFTRVPKYRLPEPEYAGWKVFYVFANRFLDRDYVFDGDTLTVKSEDSYLHLAKKIGIAFRAVLSEFEIEEGILRCGDDLMFNTDTLMRFLTSEKKSDYMGVCWNARTDIHMRPKRVDNYMVDYYRNRKQEFEDSLQGLPPYDSVMRMYDIPWIQGASGVMTYFSKQSCEYILQELDDIQWDITRYDPIYGFVYIIEDIAYACILSKRSIFAKEYPMWTENDIEFAHGKYIAFHTNDSK